MNIAACLLYGSRFQQETGGNDRSMKKTVQYAFYKSLPVMFGYVFLGTAFGILLQQAGYGLPWALAGSLFIYAGSMQFVLVTFLSSGTALTTAAVMTVLINGRHLFYGLSFVEKFKKMGKYYPYMIFSLTDETYSVLCSVKPEEGVDERKAMFLISLFDQSYWVLGSVLGSVLGQVMPLDFTGSDFSMTALFVVIFLEQWKDFPSHIPAVTGLISALVFLILLGPDRFILPSLIMTVAMLMVLK